MTPDRIYYQTIVLHFSATQTKKTEDLARISLKKMPVYIGVDDLKETATSDMLEQGYIMAESDLRLRVLYTFLKKNKNKKIMVFFSSCMSVKFHYELFNYIDVTCLSIHGKQKQTKRTSTFFSFCNADTGWFILTYSAELQCNIQVFCFVQMWLQEDWISQKSIGLSNTIPQMIQKSTFTGKSVLTPIQAVT